MQHNLNHLCSTIACKFHRAKIIVRNVAMGMGHLGRKPYRRTRLLATKLCSVRRVVCGNPDYFARHSSLDYPNALARHTCITFTALGLPDS